MSDSTHDVLSSVLRALRVQVDLFLADEMRGAWVLDSREAPFALFHLIGRGQAWLHWEGFNEPLALRGGDVVMFPRETWHRLSGSRELEPPADGGNTTLLCGRIRFGAELWNPVLAALPECIVLHSERQDGPGALGALARAMLVEHESGAPGHQAVLDRLAEAMFILMLRDRMHDATAAGGMLAALSDPRLAPALAALHREPGRRWTLADLAAEASLSRTVFASRFAAVVGMTPMSYLTHWRMQLADLWLRDGTLSVAQVAERLGYDTDAAFRRAFARVRGIGPGAVRRAHRR